ncbi:MAG: tRNA dihydrouridine synthase DusB [Chloroflexi bacterium HGW-Chloroflexi-4]|jgi:nifR3 family TIM-barrel protein|nr:MAG: tRNA dihydrouridine synthase DusB [Chloroflexi bacterium HGW-Chloroflexi-4]
MSLNHTATVFSIGNISIAGKLILAPMDGYSDSPMRLVSKQFGSAISISEFINAIDIKQGHPHLLSQIKFSDDERPFAYQIFDDKPERMLAGALKLREHNPEYIDINMGCSAKNVSNRGAGAGLLKHPLKIGQIVESLVKHLDVPVTAKIRLGWDDDSLNYLETSRIIQESGASAITVHARTRKMEYSGSARWDAIGEIKAQLSIPVIGNGDVKSLADAERMMAQTGCDAVMIGRAAIGNPWVFSGSQREEQSQTELLRVVELHLHLMAEHYGEKIGVMLFRKHLTRYLHGYLNTPEIRKHIYSLEKEKEFFKAITKLVNQSHPTETS